MDDRRAPAVLAALTMITAAGRMLDDEVRQAAPQPFGLVGNTGPLPVFVGMSTISGSAVGGVPAPRLGQLTSIALCYGIPEDPQSPFVEVLTDFTPDHADTVNLRVALGRAAAWDGQSSHPPDHLARRRGRPPKGPLPRGRLQILVVGQLRTVTTTSYQNYSGLQFSHSGKTVTAIARGHWPDLPTFAVVTDLERYCAR